MEENAVEINQADQRALLLHLPTEIWLQIFYCLKITECMALVGRLSKEFKELIDEYFKNKKYRWMNKNMNVAIIGAGSVGKIN